MAFCKVITVTTTTIVQRSMSSPSQERVPAWYLRQTVPVLPPSLVLQLPEQRPRGETGCNKDKSKCRYFHPKLCQNALATGVCVSKVCKEVHIKGTITSEETLKKSKNSQKKPAHNNSKLTHQQQQAGRDSQSRKPSTPSSRNSNPRADNSAPRSRADSASMDVPPGSGSNRQRSVSFSKSEKEQDKEDFL